MVRLYRDPRGENIFGKTNNATTGIMATNLNDPEKVTTLEKKVRDLTSQLSRYQVSGALTTTFHGPVIPNPGNGRWVNYNQVANIILSPLSCMPQ